MGVRFFLLFPQCFIFQIFQSNRINFHNFVLDFQFCIKIFEIHFPKAFFFIVLSSLTQALSLTLAQKPTHYGHLPDHNSLRFIGVVAERHLYDQPGRQ